MARRRQAWWVFSLSLSALGACTGDVTSHSPASSTEGASPDGDDEEKSGEGADAGLSDTGGDGDEVPGNGANGTGGDAPAEGPAPNDPLPPPACSASLAERTTITDLSDLAGNVASCASFAEGGRFSAPHPCARLAGAPDGTLRFAYADKSDAIHVQAIDAAGERFGVDLTVPGDDVRGLFAHADGVALLVARGNTLSIVRLDQQGKVVFEQKVEGADDVQVSGARFLDDGLRGGALDWDGTRYTVYSSIKQNFGSQGTHQGDVLTFYDATGKRSTKDGWDWGCSHSLDLRLAPGMGLLSPICQADAYPKPGIIARNRQIVATPDLTGEGGVIYSGYAAQPRAALLGGAVADGDGVFASFASNDANKRATRDIGVVRFDAKSTGTKVWHSTLEKEQIAWSPDLMRYGKNLLLYWETSTVGNQKADGYAGHLMELTSTGAATSTSVDIAASAAGTGPFKLRARDVPAVSVPGGDAAYLAAPTAAALSIVRLRACE